MDDQFRQEVIKVLKRGDELPAEWARELFPPEKREYELIYHGKEREEDILAETMAVPLQKVKTFRNGQNGNGWMNMLIFGDNLQVLKTLLQMKQEGKLKNADGMPGVRLVYIDPPFGTGDEYSISNGASAYSAKTMGARFIEFLRKRLIFLREILAYNGSIYVRIDYHFGHYIKAIMDEVFGPENFQNEIVINRFKRQLSNITRYNVATDSFFYYTMSSDAVFNQQYRKRICSFCGSETQPQWRGMSSPGLRNPPERIIVGQKLLPPRGRHWTFIQSKIEQMEAGGRIHINEGISFTDLNGKKIKGLPEYLQTEDTPVDSNWTDLKGYVFGASYPTENPEELLQRVVLASSNPGDLVLDCFAGSGTTLAVAEKLGRRWIGADCGKLAIYTMQKRLLNITKGKNLENPKKKYGKQCKPFTLYNAGLYDFSKLKDLPRDDWRFFALQLFNCRDERHTIGGLQLDGKLRGAPVLVFDHTKQPGKRIDEETVHDIHAAVGSRIGRKFFIIAPRGIFDFQQDYLDIDGIRYYALRIPYSVIDELHRREFTGLQQPNDETAINEPLDAVGFDFIKPPDVEFKVTAKKPKGELLKRAQLKITGFDTRAWIRGRDTRSGLEALSMLMLDFDYNGNVFDLDKVFYANQLESQNWTATFPLEDLGEKVMVVFIDIYGNELSAVIPRVDFNTRTAKKVKTKKAPKSKGGKKVGA